LQLHEPLVRRGDLWFRGQCGRKIRECLSGKG
jgi:hypothetical protein